MASDTPQRRRRKLSAIMMADVSGFSRLMGTNEDQTVDLIQGLHDRVRRRVEEYEGRVVDTAGDSVFGEFDSVVNAIECARRIQEDQTSWNKARPPDQHVEMRIGVHLGDVIVEDYHVYGDGVNIAARLEGLAQPGAIAISEAVYQQIQNKLDVSVHDLGLKELKNIQHPVHVYEVAPARKLSAPAHSLPAPAPTPKPDVVSTASYPPLTWQRAVARPRVLIPASIGLFLLFGPILLFPTAGVLPTAGAILLASVAGRVASRVLQSKAAVPVALGLAIASGAWWTNWSRVTNSLLVLGGLITAASALHKPRHGRRESRRAERRKRKRQSHETR